MAPRDKKGILFISRAIVQSCLSALCVHSRLANVLLRFNLDNKFQRGGGTESYGISLYEYAATFLSFLFRTACVFLPRFPPYILL